MYQLYNSKRMADNMTVITSSLMSLALSSNGCKKKNQFNLPRGSITVHYFKSTQINYSTFPNLIITVIIAECQRVFQTFPMTMGPFSVDTVFHLQQCLE